MNAAKSLAADGLFVDEDYGDSIGFYAEAKPVATPGNRDMPLIAKFSQLQSLRLSDSGVDDEGLKYIKPLAKLRIVALGNCKITDRGVVSLANLPNLESPGPFRHASR